MYNSLRMDFSCAKNVNYKSQPVEFRKHTWDACNKLLKICLHQHMHVPTLTILTIYENGISGYIFGLYYIGTY